MAGLQHFFARDRVHCEHSGALIALLRSPREVKGHDEEAAGAGGALEEQGAGAERSAVTGEVAAEMGAVGGWISESIER